MSHIYEKGVFNWNDRWITFTSSLIVGWCWSIKKGRWLKRTWRFFFNTHMEVMHLWEVGNSGRFRNIASTFLYLDIWYFFLDGYLIGPLNWNLTNTIPEPKNRYIINAIRLCFMTSQCIMMGKYIKPDTRESGREYLLHLDMGAVM